jgi:hypothetical protein
LSLTRCIDIVSTPESSLKADLATLPKGETRITVLPNGFTVATEENYSQTSAMVLFVDAGTLYLDIVDVCNDDCK